MKSESVSLQIQLWDLGRSICMHLFFVWINVVSWRAYILVHYSKITESMSSANVLFETLISLICNLYVKYSLGAWHGTCSDQSYWIERNLFIFTYYAECKSFFMIHISMNIIMTNIEPYIDARRLEMPDRNHLTIGKNCLDLREYRTQVLINPTTRSRASNWVSYQVPTSSITDEIYLFEA